MTITNFHHVSITIPRGAEDEARAFYCELLGLPEIEEPESLRRCRGTARSFGWVLRDLMNQ
jgi:catechol 2,3-dioxygenase-like lactoylglutathione lyase family enzyme